MDNIHNPPLLSVHILLPEQIDRRLKQRTQEMPGASWPSWGGHITLIPNFVPRVSVKEIRAIIESVCADEARFMIRFDAPVALPDKTRAEYFALFLTVTSSYDIEAENDIDNLPMTSLRDRLLLALDEQRNDLYPELLDEPFLPHVTLALGVSESEAQTLVRGLRAEPFEAAFWVEEIWLMEQMTGDTARLQRTPIPLRMDIHGAVLLD